ncbi:MAG: DUF2339 domain-containing protein [Acidobacteria bacterium]|nr:DUF2339 domain-containing protein [Acidobacteriota bacterium]
MNLEPSQFLVLLGNDLEMLLILAVLFLLISPVLAIAAWVRTKRLENKLKFGADTTELSGRVARLESKLAEIEVKLAAGVAASAASPPAAQPAPPPAPPKQEPAEIPVPGSMPSSAPDSPSPISEKPMFEDSVSSPPQQQVSRGKPELDLESLIAGKWLNRVGILAVLIGVGFFLKYAFDNKWIGPGGRVAMGLLAGAALLVYSQWLLKKNYGYFSEGIAGIGAGFLYESIYAGWNYYHLFPPAAAFAGMVFVTAGMMAVAIGRNSQRIAVLALAGGFLTPILTSTGQDAQVALFSYLAILNAGMIAVARFKDWRWLEFPAFFFTQMYFWGWYDKFFYISQPLLRTCGFATLYFVEFTAMPVVRARQSGKIFAEQALLALFNAGFFLFTLHYLLWPQYRWTLTLATLGLAAFHLIVVQFVPQLQDKDKPVARMLFAGLALTFVTLAIPIRLDDEWLTMAWAIEGAVLMWLGFRLPMYYLRIASFFLFGITIFRLLFFPAEALVFLMNPRFATFAVAIACFGSSLWLAKGNSAECEVEEKSFFILLAVAINVVTVWALSLEVNLMFDAQTADTWLARHLTLTLLWASYASGLMYLGAQKHEAGLRWQGLALLGLTVAKVFLYDLSYLSGFYRILSSIALGVVLLVISFFYQRSLAGAKSREGT